MQDAAILWLIAMLLIAGGLAGLVLPAIPGAPLLFAGFWIAARADNFRYVGFWTLTVLAVLAVLIGGVDLWASLFGARRFGASKRAVAGALIGSVVGLFLGFPGVVFGPFIGAVIGELFARRGVSAAARAGLGVTVGLVLGAALKLALALSMIGIFIVARFS